MSKKQNSAVGDLSSRENVSEEKEFKERNFDWLN